MQLESKGSGGITNSQSNMPKSETMGIKCLQDEKRGVVSVYLDIGGSLVIILECLVE